MRRRKAAALNLSKVRSAITNGTSLLAGQEIDGRSAWMRRYKDLITLHEADLGGTDAVSEAERRIVRRAAMITIQLEIMDAKFALLNEGAGDSALHTYQQCSNSLRRLLETLGLERRSRDVTPDLATYLRSKEATE